MRVYLRPQRRDSLAVQLLGRLYRIVQQRIDALHHIVIGFDQLSHLVLAGHKGERVRALDFYKAHLIAKIFYSADNFVRHHKAYYKDQNSH